MPAVTAENLTKRFGGLTALDGATFTAGRDELFGVIGPDGAGKTTLMRLLVTLSRPDAGRATVLGFDVVRQYAEVRRCSAPTRRRAATSSRPSTARSNASPRVRLASCRAG